MAEKGQPDIAPEAGVDLVPVVVKYGTLVDSGSAAGLDASMARANEQRKGWLGFYGAPAAIPGNYEMVRLDFGVPVEDADWRRCVTVAECPRSKARRIAS